MLLAYLSDLTWYQFRNIYIEWMPQTKEISQAQETDGHES
jgi:hypothetical protein